MENLEKKIDRIVKEEIRKFSTGKELIPKNSFENIFTMPDNVRNNPLMEGYFATYDINKVQKYLQKRYGDNAEFFIIDNENNEQIFRAIFPNTEENRKKIDKDMSLAGYFPSYFEDATNGYIDIQYEPRHQNKINDIVKSMCYLYHLTPSIKVDKILSMGLCPKTNNKMFLYPERIYCFLYKPNEELCKMIIDEFYNAEVQDYYNKQKLGKERKVPYNGEYTLLRIDTELIGNINFFYDPNAEDCVYTKENIVPDAINIETKI